jgi:hypothetical protein
MSARAIVVGGLASCVVACGRIGYDSAEPTVRRDEEGGYAAPPDGAPLVDGFVSDRTSPVDGFVGDGSSPVDGFVGDGSSPVDGFVGDGSSPVDAGLTSDGEAGVVGRCDDGSIWLYEWNLQLTSTTNTMDFVVKLENRTNARIALSRLKGRYWFTNELAMPWTTEVYYADICCSSQRRVTSNVQASCRTTLTSADAYLEFGFDMGAGDLAAGDSVQVELAFHAPAYDRNLVQANDYSFSPIDGTQRQWDACPGGPCDHFRTCTIGAYIDDVLAGGTSP